MKEFDEKFVMKSLEATVEGNTNIKLFRANVGAVQRGGRFVRFGIKGQSDYNGIVKEVRCPICKGLTGIGVRIEIEVKGPGGRVSPEQKQWIEQIKSYGGIAFVLQPKSIEEALPLNMRKRIDSEIHKPCANCAKKSEKSFK